MSLTRDELVSMEAMRRNIHEYAEDITAAAMRIRSREMIMLASQMSACELGLAACMVTEEQEDGRPVQHHEPTKPKPEAAT